MIPGSKTRIAVNRADKQDKKNNTPPVVKPQEVSCNRGEIELWNECYDVLKTKQLDLSKSNLQGRIPEAIGQLTNLTHLDLSWNKLTGKIPSSMGNLKHLIELRLFDNELEGRIPQQLINLPKLKSLSLASNNFIGDIPKDGWDDLHLGFNAFSPTIPLPPPPPPDQVDIPLLIWFEDYDINNDGVVNISDFEMLLSFVIVGNDSVSAADINFDSAVDIFDLLLLSDFLQNM